MLAEGDGEDRLDRAGPGIRRFGAQTQR